MEKLAQRHPAQSVIFILQDCIDTLDSLRELVALHKSIILSGSDKITSLPLSPRLVPYMISAVRDHICIRLRNLFDPRNDSYSLKEYYTKSITDQLKKHSTISSAIIAANKNVAHLDKEYTKWPAVEDLLTSDIKEILEAIKLNILFTK